MDAPAHAACVGLDRWRIARPAVRSPPASRGAASAWCPQRRTFFPFAARAEKKKRSQNRSGPGAGLCDASTECRWHSGPGRTGFAFRRLPARLVAVQTSRPIASPGMGRGRTLPRREAFKSCPELSLRPGLAGALFFRRPFPGAIARRFARSKGRRRAGRCCVAARFASRCLPSDGFPATTGTLSCRCTHFLDRVLVLPRRKGPAIDLPCPFRLRSGWPLRRFAAQRTRQRNTATPSLASDAHRATDGASAVLREDRHHPVGTYTCGRTPTTTG